MADYTNLGIGLWTWEPWTARSLAARMVWLALYTTPQIKRTCPALFHGDIGALHLAAKMSIQDTVDGLEELIEHGMAEYDKIHHVMRLTQLPDYWERPHSWKVLIGFWNGFKTVPVCGVRDAHVKLIRALWDARDKEPSEKDEETWAATFGTVGETASRKRGARTVAKKAQDAGVQPDLFGAAGLADPGKGIDRVSDTLCDRVWDLGSGIGDLGSGSPDARGGEVPLAPVLPIRPGTGPLPFTVAQLFGTLEATSAGHFAGGTWDPALAKPITDVIRRLGAAGVTLADIELAGRWLATGALAWKGVLGPPWVAKGGELFDAVNQARAAASKSTPAAMAKPAGGSRRPEPSPPSSFQSGWRKL